MPEESPEFSRSSQVPLLPRLTPIVDTVQEERALAIALVENGSDVGAHRELADGKSAPALSSPLLSQTGLTGPSSKVKAKVPLFLHVLYTVELPVLATRFSSTILGFSTACTNDAEASRRAEAKKDLKSIGGTRAGGQEEQEV